MNVKIAIANYRLCISVVYQYRCQHLDDDEATRAVILPQTLYFLKSSNPSLKHLSIP